MDELVGALFLFGTPAALWFGWLWAAKAMTGKTAPERAYDIRVKRAQAQDLQGYVEGRVVRDAAIRNQRKGY